MSRLWLRRLACLFAFLAVAGSAWADVTLSKSNAPGAILDAQLAELLGSERAAFGAVDPGKISRLAVKPVRRSFWNRVSAMKTGP